MQTEATVAMLDDKDALAAYLLRELRSRLHLPDKYSDQIISMNLPYLFAHDDFSALRWVEFVENRFNIAIPDGEADIFFLSSVEEMAATIIRNRPVQLY